MNFLNSAFPLKESNSSLNGADGFLIYSSQQARSKIFGDFPVYTIETDPRTKSPKLYSKLVHKVLISHLPKKDVS